MNIRFLTGTLALLLSIVSTPAFAEPLTTYVSEFKVSGSVQQGDLPTLLQRMLSARLNAENVQLVTARDNAELVITGSYATFGTIFSIDVMLQNTRTGTLSTFFEQGSGQDETIPAIGRVANKADKIISSFVAALPPKPVSVNSPVVPVTPVPVLPAVVPRQTSGYLVQTSETEVAGSSAGWESEPIEGAYSSLAVGQTRPTGEKEIFIARDHAITFYLKGAAFTRQSEVTVALPARILSLDTADLDHDGATELYVTIIDRTRLASRVYTVEGSSLSLTAARLPWFLRGIGLSAKTRTIYAQKMGMKGAFHEDVVELAKTGNRFEPRATLRLPRFGTVYTFNRIYDAKGNQRYVVLDQDGYLVVYMPNGEEVWKSADKFGGSENSFTAAPFSNFRSSLEKDQLSFLEQRITLLPEGLLLVPHNTGFGLGNNRNYGKHAFYAFQWSGSMLKEKWHTRQTSSYLADYAFDADMHALILLEVTQKPGLQKKGKTILTIRKVE
jgi:hypothetical protein